MTKQTITGGCFCGNIRFEITDDDYPIVNCHCSMCRRISGAPFVTWLVAPLAAFTYKQGKPKVLNSSNKGTRYFCADCGTPIACILSNNPEVIDVPTGSLDQPENFAPKHVVHEDSKLHWLAQTEVQ